MTFLVPQIIKLIRTRDSSGVSSTWPALGFVINVGWFFYMIHNEHWVAVFAPLVTFVSYAVILWALSRSGRILSASYVRGILWTGLLIAVTFIYKLGNSGCRPRTLLCSPAHTFDLDGLSNFGSVGSLICHLVDRLGRSNLVGRVWYVPCRPWDRHFCSSRSDRIDPDADPLLLNPPDRSPSWRLDDLTGPGRLFEVSWCYIAGKGS